MMSWLFGEDRRTRTHDGSTLGPAFQGIERSLLAAERSHRQQLQADLVRMRQLLLDAILALDGRLVNERLAADPYYLANLDMDGWEQLLQKARQSSSRRQAWRRSTAGSISELATLRNRSALSPAGPRPQPPNLDPIWYTPASVRLPNYPAAAPQEYDELIPGPAWLKWGGLLALMACTGWASASLLTECLAVLIGRSADNTAAVPEKLAKLDFLKRQVITTQTGTVTLVEFKRMGVELVERLGLEPMPSEWQRLRTAQPDLDSADVALRLIFAAHVRKRGCGAWVCPEEAPGRPDLLLREPTGELSGGFVEPALDRLRLDDWRLCAEAYGGVGLCATDDVCLQHLVHSAMSAGLPGRATDLRTLHGQPERSLWTDQWPAATNEVTP